MMRLTSFIACSHLVVSFSGVLQLGNLGIAMCTFFQNLLGSVKADVVLRQI